MITVKAVCRHVAHVAECEVRYNTYKIFTGKSEGRRKLRKQRSTSSAPLEKQSQKKKV
jgi:hypothetical protein